MTVYDSTEDKLRLVQGPVAKVQSIQLCLVSHIGTRVMMRFPQRMKLNTVMSKIQKGI